MIYTIIHTSNGVYLWALKATMWMGRGENRNTRSKHLRVEARSRKDMKMSSKICCIYTNHIVVHVKRTNSRHG
jgi:hypothetical protein